MGSNQKPFDQKRLAYKQMSMRNMTYQPVSDEFSQGLYEIQSQNTRCTSSGEEGFESEYCGSPKSSQKETTWKKKVKTELCKFWLSGQTCENKDKEQGCGFAHGEYELQKKKGLSKKYMTSVCKNFLDHPSKCTYGQRCIFQHPTYDVRERQCYTKMMQDNSRYTAMRLFQEIEGADVIYINTYAATAPRLPVFKGICSNAKDSGEDYIDSDSENEEPYYGSASDNALSFSEDSHSDDVMEDLNLVAESLGQVKIE